MGQFKLRPGDKFRHFKNKLYQIISIAEHSETGENLVVYQALYDDFKVYARPYNMFTSKVDKEKYPDVKQEYRFEYVEELGAAIVRTEQKIETLEKELDQPEEKVVEQAAIGLIDFLDAETYREKIIIMDGMRTTLTDDIIMAMADSLEIVLNSEDLKGKYFELRDCLETFNKYEKTR